MYRENALGQRSCACSDYSIYSQSWAALLWNAAALPLYALNVAIPLPLHPLDYSGGTATATVKCSAATLAATMTKIIGSL